jgi:hypothetical protein
LAYRRHHLKLQAGERDNLERLKYDAEHNRGVNGQPLLWYIGGDGFTEHKTKCMKMNDTKGGAYPIDTIANRCMGVEIVCGPVKGTILYFMDEFIHKGSNLMVEVMRRALSKLREMLAVEGFELPMNGVCSFDNSNENKNRSMFGYFSMLVELEMQTTIEVYFLILFCAGKVS